MAKKDQEELRSVVANLKPVRPSLPGYTDEVEDSVVKHVEALKRREEEGGSTAKLVVTTLTKTLDGLPSQDRIWFLISLVVLLALALAAFVFLKVRGIW